MKAPYLWIWSEKNGVTLTLFTPWPSLSIKIGWFDSFCSRSEIGMVNILTIFCYIMWKSFGLDFFALVDSQILLKME